MLQLRLIKKIVSASVILATLCACSTMEHRSDALPKSPLPTVAKNSVNPKVVWSNSQSGGVGSSQARLRLGSTQNQLVVADNKGKIISMDRLTGKTHWQVATKESITGGPSIIHDQVLVGTEDGQVLAYHLSDGNLRWKTKVTGSVLSAPQGNHDAIYVHVMDGSVYALKASDGKELWRYTSRTPSLMLRRSSSPVLHNKHVLVGFANGKLKAIDRHYGVVEWEREIGTSSGRSDSQRMLDIGADPVVKDGRIFVVSYQGKIAAVRDNGALIWERSLSSHSGIGVSDHNLFISDHTGTVWALSQQSGDVIWKQESLSGRQLATPAILRNYVVVGDEDGYLHWFSKRDGAYLGRNHADGKGIVATPVVKEDVLYVLGRSGKVIAYTVFPAEDVSEGS